MWTPWPLLDSRNTADHKDTDTILFALPAEPSAGVQGFKRSIFSFSSAAPVSVRKFSFVRAGAGTAPKFEVQLECRTCSGHSSSSSMDTPSSSTRLHAVFVCSGDGGCL